MLREAQVTCSFCPRPASERWTEVIGWSEQRSAGGQNHVQLRRDTGRRCCEQCMLDMRNGIPPGSGHLF